MIQLVLFSLLFLLLSFLELLLQLVLILLLQLFLLLHLVLIHHHYYHLLDLLILHLLFFLQRMRLVFLVHQCLEQYDTYQKEKVGVFHCLDFKDIIIEDSTWMRAKYSGLLHVKIPIGKKVEKGEYIAILTDPYGSFRHKVKATQTGYIINVNQSPIVYQGDAIFHISKEK